MKTGIAVGSVPDPAGIPIVVRPTGDALELVSCAKGNASLIDDLLAQSGAVLFRGFSGIDAASFQRFAEATSAPRSLIEYANPSTPRRPVSGRVYSSTEYPASESIPLHNELSYTTKWPRKIWFACLKPSASGGETPLADGSRVFARIEPRIRARFMEHGVTYVRTFHDDGVDLSTAEVFGTSDRVQIERLCREAGIECEFPRDAVLRTHQRCQAVAIHPRSGRTVWFNQAHLFHTSRIDREVLSKLISLYGENGLPRNCFYGDGSSIADADLDHVREAYRSERVLFRWEVGDVLFLDNTLVAHGREPFRGERNVVVVMAEATSEAA